MTDKDRPRQNKVNSSLKEKQGGPISHGATTSPKPWYQRPVPLPKNSRIAIIGGGIAGLCAGLALQNKGCQVTVYEKDPQPMAQASGNPAGILDPYLNLGHGADCIFYRSALLHALAYYHALDPEIIIIRGLTKFPTSPAEKKKFLRFLATSSWPAGFVHQAPDGALHFPDCGALSPLKIKDILARKLNIKCNTNIRHIDYNQQWILSDGEDFCDYADAVIICGGPASRNFAETNQLPLDAVRGQITLIDAAQNARHPTQVLCGKGYLIPPLNLAGRMTMITGASFVRNDTRTDIRARDHQENLENAKTLWPNITDQSVTGGRCAIRAYSPDHLPLCGPVPDIDRYQTAYNLLKHGPKHQNFEQAPYQPHLYIIAGLGSRGFMSAPLLGDMMAGLVSGHTLPVPDIVYEGLHPARFVIRNLVKGK